MMQRLAALAAGTVHLAVAFLVAVPLWVSFKLARGVARSRPAGALRRSVPR